MMSRREQTDAFITTSWFHSERNIQKRVSHKANSYFCPVPCHIGDGGHGEQISRRRSDKKQVAASAYSRRPGRSEKTRPSPWIHHQSVKSYLHFRTQVCHMSRRPCIYILFSNGKISFNTMQLHISAFLNKCFRTAIKTHPMYRLKSFELPPAPSTHFFNS